MYICLFKEVADLTLRLPPEIWIKILSYLTYDVLCEVALVNSRFRSLALDPTLWTKISLQSDAIASTETVLNLIQRCHLLTELSLRCRDDTSALLAAAARNCKNLKVLEVRFCPVLTYSDLEMLATNFRFLEHLDLECTGCLNMDNHQVKAGEFGCHNLF